MAFNFFTYKSDQGRFARGCAFWLLTALSIYGCRTLFYYLQKWSWAKTGLLEDNIPIINTALNPAFIIGVGLFLVVEYFIVKVIVNKPKSCDLLIETETEMKKVTWPSWNDALNSSLIVLLAVIFFMALLGCSDLILNIFFSEFIFGTGS